MQTLKHPIYFNYIITLSHTYMGQQKAISTQIVEGKDYQEKLQVLKQLLFCNFDAEDISLIVDGVAEIIYQFQYESQAKKFIESPEMVDIKEKYGISIQVDQYSTDTRFDIKANTGYYRNITFEFC